MNAWLAVHIIGVILWAGGAMSLSRMLAFHAKQDEGTQRKLSELEGKAYHFGVVPGLLLVLVSGSAMLMLDPALLTHAWMHAKLGLVLLLIVLSVVLGMRVRRYRLHPGPGRPGREMMLHGVIGLLVIGIICLVVLKPF